MTRRGLIAAAILGVVGCSRAGGGVNEGAAGSASVAAAPTAETGTGTVTSASPSPNPSTSTRATTRGIVVEGAVEDGDALSLIRTKRLEARAEGRVLVVYVAASWCEPCRRLKAEIAAGRLDERFDRLTLLAFDADRDRDRLEAAGYTYRFIPFVALPAPDGGPADAKQATGRGGDAWRELLGKLDAWQRGAAPAP